VASGYGCSHGIALEWEYDILTTFIAKFEGGCSAIGRGTVLLGMVQDCNRPLFGFDEWFERECRQYLHAKHQEHKGLEKHSLHSASEMFQF